MVVDPGSNDFKSVVHVGEIKKRFALDVGLGDVKGVKMRRVVVEDAEEVVVVTDEIVVRSLVGYVGGRLHGGEGTEEGIRWWRRFCGDGWRTVGMVAAKEG